MSRFHEVLKALPRGMFDQQVAEQSADKHSKDFSCWNQLVAMLYGHLEGMAVSSRFTQK
ncbi:MAG: DUF4372 domain-containing protein [Rhodanobacter sp.]|nr:DUF4372 domain-containing protein [Rhodanobacter sp.]